MEAIIEKIKALNGELPENIMEEIEWQTNVNEYDYVMKGVSEKDIAELKSIEEIKKTFMVHAAKYTISYFLSILEADKPVQDITLKEHAIRYAEWYDNLSAVDYINYRGATPRELYNAFIKTISNQ